MNKIRLTENQLHKIIKNSVNNILKESTLYCDTKPFKQIMDAANKIVEKYDYVNDKNFEPDDDYDGRDLSYDVYEWAKKTYDEAEEWLRYNSDNCSINGGEDW